MRDRAAGSLDLAPPADGTDTGGQLHPVLSRNGCVIAFWAHFDNGGWSVFKWDRCAGTAPVPVLRGSGHDPTQATYTRDLAVSDDGRFIAAIAAIPGLAGDVVMRIDTLGGANTVADGSARSCRSASATSPRSTSPTTVSSSPWPPRRATTARRSR